MSEHSTKVFLLIKPECTPYINHIEPILNQHSLSIESLFFIENWLPIAREIYKQRIASEPPEFKTGFEGHLWLSNLYFGHKAILLVLQSSSIENMDILSIAERANNAKAEFRQLIPQTRDGRIVTCINIEQVKEINVYDGLISGEVGIKESNENFNPYGIGKHGLWGYFYFKYIHVPTANHEELSYEWSALNKMNVLNQENRISLEDWRTIVTLNAFLHPKFLSAIKRANSG